MHYDHIGQIIFLAKHFQRAIGNHEYSAESFGAVHTYLQNQSAATDSEDAVE